jgi:deoxyadenosine/deoxycytidine kinase
MAAEALPLQYLAIDGPIGVGKTTLVDMLVRRFDAVRVLEDPNNPFLPDFYQDCLMPPSNPALSSCFMQRRT